MDKFEWWIKRVNATWVGPYPTWEEAEEDRRALGFLYAQTVKQGTPTVKPSR